MPAGALLAAATAAALHLCAPFHDEAAGRFGYLQCDGSPGLPARYSIADDFNAGGIAAVLDETGWHYLDRQGRFVARPFIFDNGPDYFEEGLARFVQGGKIGFMDDAGRVVIPAVHDFAFPFQDGKAEVGQDCTTAREHEHGVVTCRRWSTIARPDMPPHR